MQRFSKYVLMFSLLLSAAVAWAGPVTQQIPFTTRTTLAVPETYTFRFSLWDIATGGTAGANRVWWEIKDIDMATKTLATNLGSVTSAVKRSGPISDVDFSEQYWVQVEKLGADGKTWKEVGTRTKFMVVPYAMWSAQGGDDISVTAGNGLTGTTGPDGEVTLNVGAGDGISVSTDQVSIANGGVTSTMLAANAVTSGKISLPYSGSGNAPGILFSMTNSGSKGIGLKGIATDINGIGVSGEGSFGLYGSSINGVGVVGSTSYGFAGMFLGTAYFRDRVGIGTSEPLANLHVSDGVMLLGTSASKQLRMRDTGSAIDIESVGVPLYINNSTGQNIYLLGGNVGVGTNAPGFYKLYVAGNAYTTGTLTQGSDVRWKKNIATLESSLEKVLQLRGVSYDWNTEEYPDKGFTEDRQIGLIAQEVEPVLPEVVKTGSDGYKGVTYDSIVAVLVEAIKAQQAQIKEQQVQLKEQQARIEELGAEIAELKGTKALSE